MIKILKVRAYMTKIFRAAFVVLSVAAILPAQVPPRSNYQYVSEGAGAEMFGNSPAQTYSITFSETIHKRPNSLDGAWLDVSLCTQVSCVYGSGPIPANALTKVQEGRAAPAMVNLAIRDLHAVPGYVLWGDAPVPSPFAFSATLRATNHLKTEEDIARTTENFTPDGTLFKDVVRGRSVASSARGTAIINGVQLEPPYSARVLDERSVVHAVTVTKQRK